jgi:flagellar L-ring protein precursor FlgH
MAMKPLKRSLVVAAASLLLLSLPACSNLKRLSHLGDPPPLSPMGKDQQRDDKRVSLPMPMPDTAVYEPNSLWRSGARAFFKDQRAAKLGDILTIDIEITDKAELNNETERKRDSAEKQDLTNFLGFEGRLGRFLPDPVDPQALVRMGSNSVTNGSGSINREEKINLTVAAIVTQVLPNGNLVIQGRQEVRVNNEKRDLYVSGVVRPEDISNTNTIKHTQIAEARISYGGQGIISDMQKPRYGQEAFDLIFPF